MVSNTNSEYTENRSIWESNRDAFSGQKAIKEGGIKYLPPKGYHLAAGMSKDTSEGSVDYLVFLQKAIFFNAVYRTVTAMNGLVFRKNPFIKGKKEVEPYVKKFTNDNKSLNTAAEQLTKEVILQGRAGVLVSYPDIDTEGMSKQDVEDRGIQSYSAIYKTEDIINWKIQKIEGSMVVTLVVLKEVVDAPWNTQFSTEKATQYRVLELDKNGEYKQSLYFLDSFDPNAKKDENTGAYPSSTYYPLMDGERLKFIPFFPVGTSGVTWEVEKSPMEDITTINIGHYRNSADYESGLSITASPTVVLTGFEIEKGEKVVLGGNSAILMPNSDGKAFFLEYQGNGLGSIATAMSDKKKEMAVLGLRILSSEQSVNEGADTASIHQSGEQSVLSSISNSVSEALTKALRLMVEWDNPNTNTDDIIVKLNTDFIPNAISANTINALTVLWKSMGLSDLEMFDVLKRGEIIPSEMTFEEHQKQIKASTAYSMFMELGEGSGDDFTKAVDVNRLTKADDPGNAQASKKPDVDSGDTE